MPIGANTYARPQPPIETHDPFVRGTSHLVHVVLYPGGFTRRGGAMSPNAALRILIVDDHPVMRRGVRALIEARPPWSVCGEASTGRQAIDLARRLKPDIVVMDLMLPELNGLDATRQILKEAPATEVVVLTMHDAGDVVHEVLQAGARGYVLKSDADRLLVDAVESLGRHTPFFTSTVAALVTDGHMGQGGAAPNAQEAPAVTSREREIIQLIAAGQRSKAIAGQLGISLKTVEAHRTNIMRKLRIHSIIQLVRYAIRHHLTEI